MILKQPLHWPPPPYEWHVLRANKSSEEWRLQWQHYEPLLASCGYTVTWADFSIHPDECPRGFHLPPAADPFFPRPDESFVAFPIARPLCTSTNHPLVRVANDAQERPVAIKAMLASSDEYAITKYLRNLRLVAPDPVDHTIPILDMIEVDATAFVVMPKWGESVVPFWTLVDVLDHFEECLQGLVFMHEHRIAHLDIYMWNILMNYEGPPRFKFTPGPFRSLFNARYAFIDFGQSKQFPNEMDLSACIATSNVAGVHAPEQSAEAIPFNPFRADVYQLGRAFIDYLKEDEEFTNISELVIVHIPELSQLMEVMTSQDPELRPSAECALRTLRAIRSHASSDVLCLHVELKEGVEHHGDYNFNDQTIQIIIPRDEGNDARKFLHTPGDAMPSPHQIGSTGGNDDV